MVRLIPNAAAKPGNRPVLLRLLSYLLLVAILALATYARFAHLGAVSFTFDAAAVSNLAVQWVDHGEFPMQGMVSSAGYRNPPLMVYLTSLPVIFSRDPLVITGFVAMLNLLGVVGAFWLGRRYWSVPVGLIAALLFAVSPWVVERSRGVQGQDLLAPGVILLMALLAGWFVDGKRWALAAAVAVLAALINLHLAAIALVPVLAALLLWDLIGHWRSATAVKIWTPLAVGAIIGLLLFTPYLAADAQQGWQNLRGFVGESQAQRGTRIEALDFLLLNIGGRNIHSLAGPARFREFLAQLPTPNYLPDRIEEWLAVASAAYLGMGLLRRHHDVRRARSNALLLLWFAIPPLFYLVFSTDLKLHYLVVIYPAPYLLLAVAAQDLYDRLEARGWLQKGLVVLGSASLIALVVWQMFLTQSIYRFVDQKSTPDGWATPARILRETARTVEEYARLNPSAPIVVLCRGVVAEWDECPAVWTFLTSQMRAVRFLDYNDAQFLEYQALPEALVLLTPGDSLAATALPTLAQALAEADVPLRENQGAYRLFRFHNPYSDIAAYLETLTRPGVAVVLVGQDQAEDLARFYSGSVPIYDLSQQPPDRAATLEQLEQIAGQHSSLIGVYRASQVIDPDGLIDGWLATNAYPSAETWLGPVRVVRYVLPGGESNWTGHSPEADFADQLRLNLASVSNRTVEAGDLLAVRLNWQALATPASGYSVFTHLLDDDNRLVAQRDLPLLASGTPTDAWQPGQQAVTKAAIAVPAGAAPGSYRLIAGLYDSQSGTRLRVGDGDLVDLGTVQIARPSKPGAVDLSTLRFRPNHSFGAVVLEGFDRYKQGYHDAPSTPLAPGDTVDFVFQWRAVQQSTEDWFLTVQVVDARDKPLVTTTGPLADARFPVGQWAVGEFVLREHSLGLPLTIAPGRYRMRLAVHSATEPRPGDWLGLGNIVVGP